MSPLFENAWCVFGFVARSLDKTYRTHNYRPAKMCCGRNLPDARMLHGRGKPALEKGETSLLAVDFVRETSRLFFRVVKSPWQRTTALTKRKTTATKLLSTATTAPNKHLFWLQIGNVCECVSATDCHPVFHSNSRACTAK